MYNIHLLPALFGDAILIEYGTKANPYYILIDGGPYYGYKKMMAGLKKAAPKLTNLELLIITHIDIDHIDGIIKLLNQKKLPFAIKEVWFNGYEEINKIKSDMLGGAQEEYLSLLIRDKNLAQNKQFGGNAIMVQDYNKLPVKKLDSGMEITLLSPGTEALLKLKEALDWNNDTAPIRDLKAIKERLKKDHRYKQEESDMLGLNIEALQQIVPDADTSPANRSSIAFIGKYDKKTCLFAGDATSDYLLKAIDPMLKKSGKARLPLDAWKLAHHGSKKSNLVTLMQKIDTKQMLVSSDGSRYHHPDPECIAKLIGANNGGLNFHFNYLSKDNKGWNDANLQKTHKYTAHYPASGDGITVVLKP